MSQKEQEINSFVVGCAGVLYDEAVSSAQRVAVKNTILLAQLASNTAKPAHSADWYVNFQSLLAKCGWITKKFTSFQQYQPSSTVVQLNEVSVSLFSPYLPAAAKKNFVKMLDYLNRRTNLQARSLLNFIGVSDSSVAYQFLYVYITEEQSLGLKILSFYFQSSESYLGFLYNKFDSKTIRIDQSLCEYSLNETLYNTLAHQIASTLDFHLDQDVVAVTE